MRGFAVTAFWPRRSIVAASRPASLLRKHLPKRKDTAGASGPRFPESEDGCSRTKQRRSSVEDLLGPTAETDEDPVLHGGVHLIQPSKFIPANETLDWFKSPSRQKAKARSVLLVDASACRPAFWLLMDEGAAQSGAEWRDQATPLLINFIYRLSSSMSIIHTETFFLLA